MQPDLTGNTSRNKSLSRSRAQPDQLGADPRNPGDQRRSARLSANLAEYPRLNRERKAIIRSDRRNFWNDQAERLEMTAQTNNFFQVFKILQRARAGHSIKTSLVKDREAISSTLIATAALGG